MIELKPYQMKGVEFLLSRKVAILADDMGLGKSAQVIRALVALNDMHPSQKIPSLIIGPAISRLNWENEFRKFAPQIPTYVADSTKTLNQWDGTETLITSYSLAGKVRSMGFNFNVVVPDEFHFLKTKESLRSQAVFGRNGIAHSANRTWALSGTPMPNHAGELWTVLRTFGATKLNYFQFIETYCNYTGGFRGGKYAPLIITGTKKSAIPRLRELLSRVMLRRTCKILNLPPLRYGLNYDVIIPKSKYLPDDLLEDFDLAKIAEEEKLLKTKITSEALAFLAPSVSTLRRYTGLMKVEGVAELVTSELELNCYDKIVIFCIHKKVVKGLRRRLWQFNPVTLYGEDASAIRQHNIDVFNNSKKHKVLIANILAAGTAVNLTGSDQVLFAEQDWVPGNNAQAMKRCHRLGQTSSVLVRVCKLPNSLDVRINEILTQKTKDILLTFQEERNKYAERRKQHEESN